MCSIAGLPCRELRIYKRTPPKRAPRTDGFMELDDIRPFLCALTIMHLQLLEIAISSGSPGSQCDVFPPVV